MYFLLVLLYLQLLVLLHYNAQQTPIQHLPNTSLPNLLPPNLLPPNLLPPNLLPPNLLPPNLPPQNVHEGHPPPFANQRFPNGCRNAGATLRFSALKEGRCSRYFHLLLNANC